MRHRLLRHAETRHRILAIDHDTGDAVCGGTVRHVGDGHLLLPRHADGKPVVLDDEDHGQPACRREIQRLVKVTLACGAFATRCKRHRILAAHPRCERDPSRVKQLRAHGRAGGDDVVAPAAVVRRHLPPAAVGIICPRQHGQQMIARCHTQHECQSQVAVVRRYPVIAGAEVHAESDLNRLVSHARDPERRPPLPVQHPHPLVEQA